MHQRCIVALYVEAQMSELFITADEILRRAGSLLSKCSSLRWLEGLLTHPNQPFHPTVLRHAAQLEYYCNELEYAVIHNKYEYIRCTEPDGRYHVIDSRTLAECLKFLTYLKGKMEQCRENNDYAKLDDLENEHKQVLDYLVCATNKLGKPYSFKTKRESDYNCIRMAFRRLLAKLQTYDPELADYVSGHLDMKGKFMWRE